MPVKMQPRFSAPAKIDSRPVPTARSECRLFAKIRNEAARLPHFISYYRRLGVQRFFIVDNDSTDGSRELLLGYEDCHVFHTCEHMSKSRAGMDWIEPLLSLYGEDNWCLIVDADELLVYEQSEHVRLPTLCSTLAHRGKDALLCIMLDMYPEGNVHDLEYEPGQSFVDVCPLFDSRGYNWNYSWRHKLRLVNGDIPTITGGPRLRMFYPELVDLPTVHRMQRRALYRIAIHPYLARWRWIRNLKPQEAPSLTKVPLMKWHRAMRVAPAAHCVSGASIEMSNGALLHFKFLGDFGGRVKEEVGRRAYFNGGEEYLRYYARMGEAKPLNFRCEASARFNRSRDLVELGLIGRVGT